MTKKTLLQLTCIVLLAALAVYLSRDWFTSPDIQIMTTTRPNRLPERLQKAIGPAVEGQPYLVMFALDKDYVLTSVKVVDAASFATNRFAHPLWELETRGERMRPVKSFTYGRPIRGMQPTVKGAQADPLVWGRTYLLVMETEDQTAEHSFTLKR